MKEKLGANAHSPHVIACSETVSEQSLIWTSSKGHCYWLTDYLMCHHWTNVFTVCAPNEAFLRAADVHRAVKYAPPQKC